MPQSKGMHRFRSTGLNALAGLALMLCLLPVRAADVRNLSVTHVDGEFIVAAELVLQTSKEGVFRILADYGQWHRLNHSIISSRIVSVDDGHHFVQSLTRACLLFFCRNISQTQDVTEVDDHELIAVTLPEPGNLRRGLVRWRLEQERDHARVLLLVRLAPDFWIPPLIGPWSIKAALRREVLETAGNLERLATPAARALAPEPTVQ